MIVSKISWLCSFKYLCLCHLCCSWYNVMVFMFNNRTQHTYTFLVSTTENLEDLLMFLADHLLQSFSGISQIVFLSFKPTLMLFRGDSDSKSSDTSDRTWQLCIFFQYRRHTAHLQLQRHSQQRVCVFFSFSTTSASMVFLAKQVLDWRSVCTEGSCRLSSDPPDPSSL